MFVKKYFLSSCLLTVCLLFYGSSCNDADLRNHNAQEERDLYTHNPYTLPRYSLEEFQALLATKSSSTHIQKLKNRFSEWHTAGTEEAPSKLWMDYRRERERDFQALKAEPIIQDFFNCWGNFIESRTDSNEKKTMEAIRKLEADAKSKKVFEEAAAIYYQPKKFILTEATVAYYRCLRFMLDRGITPLDELLDCLQKAHSNLKVWKKEAHPMGVELWRKICQRYAKELKDSKYFQYSENQNAIENSLKFTDKLINSPYNFSYHALYEELPHGLQLLHKILQLLDSKIELQKEVDIKELQTYCKLIKLSAILEGITPQAIA